LGITFCSYLGESCNLTKIYIEALGNYLQSIMIEAYPDFKFRLSIAITVHKINKTPLFQLQASRILTTTTNAWTCCNPYHKLQALYKPRQNLIAESGTATITSNSASGGITGSPPNVRGSPPNNGGGSPPNGRGSPPNGGGSPPNNVGGEGKFGDKYVCTYTKDACVLDPAIADFVRCNNIDMVDNGKTDYCLCGKTVDAARILCQNWCKDIAHYSASDITWSFDGLNLAYDNYCRAPITIEECYGMPSAWTW